MVAFGKWTAIFLGALLFAVPAFATDIHHLTINTTAGGSIQVFNFPGVQADPPTFSSSEISTAQAAGQMAGWSTVEVGLISTVLNNVGSCTCTTAYFRANGEFAGCWGVCRDCSECTVTGSSTGKAQISVKLP